MKLFFRLFLKSTFTLGLFLLLTESLLALPHQKIKNQDYIQIATKNSDNSDVELLIKALIQFISNNSFQIESQLNISADFAGGNVNFRAQTNTIINAKKKYRSEIKFINSNEEIGKEYLVVSDGNQVWIYNVAEKKYSIMSYSAFEESSDDFLIGMLSSVLLEVLQDSEDLEILTSLSEDELLLIFSEELKPYVLDIERSVKIIEGNEYQTFSYEIAEEGFTMMAFVNSVTSNIDYFLLKGSEESMFFMIEEKIIKKTELKSVPENTFNFTPPIGIEKSETPLEISPF